MSYKKSNPLEKDDRVPGLDFCALVGAIRQVSDNLTAQAGRAVNISLTLRNWMIGAYIDEYELCGADRANYGDKLLVNLSRELKKHGAYPSAALQGAPRLKGTLSCQ